MKIKEKDKGLYGYFFHYNDHTGLWAAYHDQDRENYVNRRYPHPGSKATFSESLTDLINMASEGTLKRPQEQTIYQRFGLEEPKNEV